MASHYAVSVRELLLMKHRQRTGAIQHASPVGLERALPAKGDAGSVRLLVQLFAEFALMRLLLPTALVHVRRSLEIDLFILFLN